MTVVHFARRRKQNGISSGNSTETPTSLVHRQDSFYIHYSAVREADSTFEPYAAAPTDVPVDITADVVETVASKLTNVAGPGGTEAIDLHNWLLRFGSES
jgi:hypothetical protein